MSSWVRRALRRAYQHMERILLANFDGDPVTTVMVVYSPTTVALVEDMEKFYEDLRTAIRDVLTHNFLAILGDFNARLGPENARFTYHDATNRNGEHLATLLAEHELLAANTLFQKRMGKRWTFQDRATGMLHQLDYIQARYTVEVRNRFRLLDVEESPNAMYKRFVAAHVEASDAEDQNLLKVQASGGRGGA
ncbi:hypothetical protein AAFF_G00344390 [Aldrovandia affinis]|uniref:Endonuclease/exonuclease/phosphatase domain-containing protein n=1 Tax=Aldrovandia affinis TaxID=143900 RepID=A0AAD7SK32_9TELE|nr:hypothetical protein AAFF_G00344390 [Aldrovandia affinis]